MSPGRTARLRLVDRLRAPPRHSRTPPFSTICAARLLVLKKRARHSQTSIRQASSVTERRVPPRCAAGPSRGAPGARPAGNAWREPPAQRTAWRQARTARSSPTPRVGARAGGRRCSAFADAEEAQRAQDVLGVFRPPPKIRQKRGASNRQRRHLRARPPGPAHPAAPIPQSAPQARRRRASLAVIGPPAAERDEAKRSRRPVPAASRDGRVRHKPRRPAAPPATAGRANRG